MKHDFKGNLYIKETLKEWLLDCNNEYENLILKFSNGFLNLFKLFKNILLILKLILKANQQLNLIYTKEY
jgi:hypothetical protein